jgi:hypothetical protein
MKEEIKIEDYEKGILIQENGDTIIAEFAYPRQNKIKHIEIGLSDVRASDGIRIHYDFERDGYVIEQPILKATDKGNYTDCSDEWHETAFCKSWILSDKDDKECCSD